MNQLDVAPKDQDILSAVALGELSPEDALEALTPTVSFKGLKKARFVKISIDLPNESARLNMFLRALFAMPLPIVCAKLALKVAKKKGSTAIESHVKDEQAKTNALKEVNDLEGYYEMIRYAKHCKVDIITNDAIIHIKII